MRARPTTLAVDEPACGASASFARASARRRARQASSRHRPSRPVRSGTRPRARARGASPPGDALKTSATESSTTKPRPWAVSLARVFEWEDVLEADGDAEAEDDDARRDDGDEASTSEVRGALTRGTRDEFVVIDGANVAWGLAQKLKSRFQAKVRVPMSAAVLMALDYEPWRARGIKTHAFIPKEYVIGYVNSVCDGGGLATVNAACVEYVGKGLWCNRRLMDEVDRGRVTLVSRAGDDGRGLRKADDLTILSRAKEVDAWICSNDKFRDHRRERGIGFSGGKALKEFARLRRMDHNFVIAPGLDDDVLAAMLRASDWSPTVGASYFPEYDGPDRRAVERDVGAPVPYHAMPHDVLPIYFEPLPTDAMKTARKTFLERRDWSVPRVVAPRVVDDAS